MRPVITSLYACSTQCVFTFSFGVFCFVIPATPRTTPVMGSRFGIMQLLVVLNFAVAWVAKGLTRRSNTNIIKVPKWMKSFGEIIYYPKISIMLVGGSVLITNKPLSYGYGMTGVEHSGNEDIQPLLSNIEPFV
ncbi:uncharacterized protein [Typha latifolia]|uniref:uncharacterized protein isoform X2 n=1 Tax=Typha latifolia TaxID=4733 RepID=UPI003C2BCDB9